MSTRTLTTSTAPAIFGSFTIDRTFRASPKRVFAAWATPEAKAQWFAGTPGEYVEEIREMNFREGGSDRLRGRWNTGRISDFRNTYWEIIPEKRIVYAYEMIMDDRIRMSVSLATIQFRPEGTGTRMTLTEQGAFLEPYDPKGDDAGSREHGTKYLVEKLAAYLDG
ncbi:MAG TPA: SRPBCC family protein [Hyphomonadaceae bacterium]|nr:SRPBCC family protein [Hyphomonadaceae bacterium]